MDLTLSDQIFISARKAGIEIPLQYWREFEVAWMRYVLDEAERLVKTEEPQNEDEEYTWMHLRDILEYSLKRRGCLFPSALWIRRKLDLETDVLLIGARLKMDPFLQGIVERWRRDPEFVASV